MSLSARGWRDDGARSMEVLAKNRRWSLLLAPALIASTVWGLSRAAPPAPLERRLSTMLRAPLRAVPAEELAPPTEVPAPRDDPWLTATVERLGGAFPSVVRDLAVHRLQILVTELDGDRRVEHGFRVDAEYFYPASAIKTFVAVAALDHLEELARDVPIDLHTPMVFCLRGETRCTVSRDPTNIEGGAITVGHEIRKMQLVSSNLAYNHLFDFVGHERLNRALRAMGFTSVRLEHHIGGGAPGGRVSPPIDLGVPAVARLERRASALPVEPIAVFGARIGQSHYDEAGRFVEEPADFRFKNYASLRDLHRLLLALVGAPGVEPLPLDEKHRAFLVQAMEEDPTRSENPPYRGARFSESRFKVMLRGIERVLPRAAVRHVGKGGRAYGFEIDNAYVEHRESGRAFAVTAVLYANPNEIINDDGYAYELSAGFFEALGTELARAFLIAPRNRAQAPPGGD